MYDALDEIVVVKVTKEEVDKPLAFTVQEVLLAQRFDAFCTEVLVRKDRNTSRIIETDDAVLRIIAPGEEEMRKIVIPQVLRSRIIRLAHHAKMSGHPAQRHIYEKLRRKYYWPHMAADVATNVRNCGECASNRLQLSKRTNPSNYLHPWNR